MKLEGLHICLRAPEPSDVDILYKWENDMSNWDVSGTQVPYSRFSLEQFVSPPHQDLYLNRQMRLMIEKTESQQCIGCVDLFEFDARNRRAGIGILIGEENERGKGYARETLRLVIDYAGKILGLHQLYANVLSGNTHSLSLFEKTGFRNCGIKQDWMWIENEWKAEYFLQYIIKP